MNKSKKLSKKQLLNSNTKTIKTVENKCDYDNSSIAQVSKVNMSDEKYYNFSDSSLELLDTFKPKLKTKTSSIQNIESNIVIDKNNLTNESYTKSKLIKNTNSSNIITLNSSNSSSNESFKSTTSVLSNSNGIDNNNQDFGYSPTKLVFNSESTSKLVHKDVDSSLIHVQNNSDFKNNYFTPKEQHNQTQYLLESAKLLDSIYGKEWRGINGVIKDAKKKNLNDELNNEHILKNNCNKTISSLTCETLTSKLLQNNDIETVVNDTSIILENFSFSNNLDVVNSISSQYNVNTQKSTKLKNVKQISKSKKDIKKQDPCLNQQSKVPIEFNLEANLSFLSSLSCFTGSMKCHPEAEKYKLKFNKNKNELVTVLFKLFNEEIFDNKLPANMDFKWNARLRSTAGACFNKRTMKINENLNCVRISRIELSSKIIDTTERLRDTLIHELCHAACWIFNGISEGHGPFWKIWANKAMLKFPELPMIKRCHSYDIQTKFTYKCIKCSYSFGRHSKSLNLEKKRCGYCYGEFELIINKINKNPSANNNFLKVYKDPLNELYNLNDEQTKPKLPKKPSKFALFVKENYNQIKQENPLSKHGEIMKLLGSKYATTKMLTPDEVFDKLFDS